jgi:succinate dehydrogenase / fumarate reductase flavoprotein subunit
MTNYAPNMMELASRDVVSRAETREIEEGRDSDGCVFLDCRHLGEQFINERLSQIRELGKDLVGIDIVHDPIPICPGMHYQMGGIKTDVDGRTPLPGVYAAGEAANVSVHGSNRLGANSLLDTIVFGRRSGEHAAEATRGVEFKSFNIEGWVEREEERLRALLARESTGDRVASIRFDLGTAMNQHIGVVRDEDGMREGLEKVLQLKQRYETVPVEDKGRTFNTDLVFALELGYMLDCAETIVNGAIERKESRGAQYRSDYTDRDDENWLKHILVTRREDGPVVSHLPVVITQWQPQVRSY